MPITTKEFEPRSWRDVLDKTLCDKVCQWIATGFLWVLRFSFTNKSDRHDITEILVKVALNTINFKKKLHRFACFCSLCIYCSDFLRFQWIKTYNIGANSTLPSVPKKRKFENDTDEEDVKPEIPKTELTGNLYRCDIQINLCWQTNPSFETNFQQIWENENFFWIPRVGAMLS